MLSVNYFPYPTNIWELNIENVIKTDESGLTGLSETLADAKDSNTMLTCEEKQVCKSLSQICTSKQYNVNRLNELIVDASKNESAYSPLIKLSIMSVLSFAYIKRENSEKARKIDEYARICVLKDMLSLVDGIGDYYADDKNKNKFMKAPIEEAINNTKYTRCWADYDYGFVVYKYCFREISGANRECNSEDQRNKEIEKYVEDYIKNNTMHGDMFNNCYKIKNCLYKILKDLSK